jgi:hypothetical protein
MKNKTLKVTHNAAFFSCCSIRLYDIIEYFNQNKEIPEVVDSSEQFQLHKYEPGDITPYFFTTVDDDIKYQNHIKITNSSDEIQFSNYDFINFEQINPFVKKYFKPSQHVEKSMDYFTQKYNMDFDKICGVFYRGLDKSRETSIASYDIWINKCLEIKSKYNVRFFIQTDETEFSQTFLQNFPDSIFIEEIPTVSKSDTLVTNHIPLQNRVQFGIDFLAVTILLSKCKYLITHSGNCGNWSCLFRGNTDNVYQWVTSSKNKEFNPNLSEYNYWGK